ncbi:MAG: hypothetical protein KGL16_09100 [Acidobacteriota bacterium]|nr:hypothetical protein [Acidobacteriota bacterium]
MSMDFLEAVEQQLVAATERGVRRRRWRWPWLMQLRVPLRAPSLGIATGIGAALAASAIAATVAIPTSKPRAHAASPYATVRSYTTAGAVPAGFEPQSFTAISEVTWWLLGTAPCDGHTCTTLVRTTDGGPLFSRLPAPPTGAVSQVSQVRFADRADGYVFGPQLWSTHDDGRSWIQQRLGTSVTDLAIAGGYAYAVVFSRGRATLMRSPVGADAWTTLHGAGRGQLSGLWVQGTTVVVQSGSRLLVSLDSGASFARKRGVRHAGNCSYDGGLQALWALCSTGMAPDQILLSGDLGNSFRTAAQVPNGPLGTFAAAGGSTAVASSQGPLYRTINAGASWAAVNAPSANWVYLGFTDASHGVAIGQFGNGNNHAYQLYYTTDAGASYHLVPIGP